MTDPQPLDAFDLVQLHDAPGEKLWLLGWDRLAVHFPVRIQKVLGVVPHSLRQTILDVLVGISHFLDVLCLQFFLQRCAVLTSRGMES